MPRTLTNKEVENLFLDIWYGLSPETYDTLWYEGIEGVQLISDCAKVYPKLYRNLLNRLEDQAQSQGFVLP